MSKKKVAEKVKSAVKNKNLHTLLITVIAYVVITALISEGVLSRHYQSLLVPVGINIILAVSLNLTVGFLGELTLGHAALCLSERMQDVCLRHIPSCLSGLSFRLLWLSADWWRQFSE